MRFPEFQGSGLTWTEFSRAPLHLAGIQLTSRNKLDLSCKDINLWIFQWQTIKEREKWLQRDTRSCKNRCKRRHFCSNEQSFQSAVGFWGSSTITGDANQQNLHRFGLKVFGSLDRNMTDRMTSCLTQQPDQNTCVDQMEFIATCQHCV